nr:mediator of RNA polymerase II transcription subunit 15 isoform X2 [Leptinotarsa decemlineata]XP_023013949.1 mediator of RNA polymerase II transcription subunit 15 isoform X2 [Leptinotarsa decemlineata]
MTGPGPGQGGPGMPDPINALQNLASQGTRNPLMNMGPQPGQMAGQQQATATNLLQTLNRGPGQQMMMGNMQGNMTGGMSMQDRQNIGIPPNGGQMGGNQMSNQMANQIRLQQMQSSGMNQMPSHLGGQLQSQIQNQMGNQMGSQMGNQMPGQLSGQMQMGNTMPSQIQNQMMGGMSQMGQQKPQSMIINQINPNFPRQPTPNQMFNQSTSPSVQSPAGLGSQPPVASPVLAPSPGAPMSMMGGPPRSVGMAPSPGSSLNTPGQPNPSPLGGGSSMIDDQAYRDKVRQLSKYIEPLRKMIARMGNEDGENLSKMKKLLEILSNPHQQRTPLDILKKCEIVLEKIDFRRGDGTGPASTPQTQSKEPHVFHALLDAINSNLHSPVINHTLHRTFGPTLDALFGPEIKLVPPLKKIKVEEPTGDIPDVLQGEIARLDPKFKVSLDPNQQPGSKSIQLICWLDDKHLPCVPPISLVVPEDYPKMSPTCSVAPNEYNATEFLSKVQINLFSRIKKLPQYFSVSHVLDTWEMSVRQAAAGSTKQMDTLAVMLGL